jgi:hypothetical protein
MKYPEIRKLKLSYKDIARIFKFKNVNSFRHSSARKRYLEGINEVLRLNNSKC